MIHGLGYLSREIYSGGDGDVAHGGAELLAAFPGESEGDIEAHIGIDGHGCVGFAPGVGWILVRIWEEADILDIDIIRKEIDPFHIRTGR